MGVEDVAPAGGGGEDGEVIGHAVFFVEGLFCLGIGRELCGEKDAVSAHFDDALNKCACRLGNGCKGLFYAFSVAFLDVLHHVRAKLGCCGERAEDGEYDGDFSCVLSRRRRRYFCSRARAPSLTETDVTFSQSSGVLTGVSTILATPPFFYFGVVDFDAEVLDAVHAIVHGFQDVHVVSLVEIIGMFCIGHRIEIDAGQVRPEE